MSNLKLNVDSWLVFFLTIALAVKKSYLKDSMSVQRGILSISHRYKFFESDNFQKNWAKCETRGSKEPEFFIWRIEII